MAKIRGYGFTRKDKVFAEFETNVGKFTFKESHSSKDSFYKVGIYAPSGEKIYNVSMSREQINRIKSGSGITNIEFTGEEGFKHFIENVYINREFNAQNFHDFYKEHFASSYAFISDKHYKITSETETLEGDVEKYYNRYIAYLVSLAPENVLENIYNNKRSAFTKVFNYSAYNQSLSSSEEQRNIGSVIQFLEKIEAETKQALGARGIEYLSYNEFVSSGEYNKFKPKEKGSNNGKNSR